jgi:tRNA A37 methylthiotransferase MiaB
LSPRTPHILLVNPWIHDFAAYDFWAKPYGLLSLAGILRHHGYPVTYLDCLDRFHPRARPADPAARNGRGPYGKERIEKPAAFSDVARNYSRYGIAPEWFRQDLSRIAAPDLILVTCLMTYWYPGAREAVDILRRVFPGTPVVLGGVYATLCPGHAAGAIGADAVIQGPAFDRILSIVEEFTGAWRAERFDPFRLDTYPWPAFDLQRKIGYVALLTAMGCPYSCAYCASGRLQPQRLLRSPESVLREMRHWHTQYGVCDFAFYDDALLVDAPSHAHPLFEQIIASGMEVRLHTPNAVHIREITPKTARLMARAGFDTVRLGLETMDFSRRAMDRKVRREEFDQAVHCLREAGFAPDRLGAYLLVGLPGQKLSRVRRDVRMVRESGIRPVLAHYSPIPQTAMWEDAVRTSRYDLSSDPIYTNNAVFPCLPAFDWQELSCLKEMAAAPVCSAKASSPPSAPYPAQRAGGGGSRK